MVLKNFPRIMQGRNDFACYIACAAMIYNYLLGKSVTIQSVVRDFGVDPMSPASAVVLLERMMKKENKNISLTIDEYAIPKPTEIFQEIKENKPLLCCVGDHLPAKATVQQMSSGERFNGDGSYQNGHWIVIIGCDGQGLTVADPACRKAVQIPYNFYYYRNIDENSLYWANTSYVDF